MSSEIIQSVVCDNYYDFQHVNFIFFTLNLKFTLLKNLNFFSISGF
jgi:hypothetical protein